MERHSKPPTVKHSELRLRALLDLTKGLSIPLDLEETMELVVREVLRVLGMERGVLLMERGAGVLETVAACQACAARENPTGCAREKPTTWG